MKVRSQSLSGVLTANAALRKRRPNPLRTDPTRTGTLRRALKVELRRRLARLRAELVDLIVREDVFGLRLSPTTFAGIVKDSGLRPFTPTEPPAPTHFLTNTRWKLFSLAEKVRAFADWLKARLDDLVDGMTRVWQGYTERAYRQGVKRAYEDARARGHIPPAPNIPVLPVGGRDAVKDQFISTTLRKPASSETINLLAARADTAFKAVTDAVERNSLRQLADLLVQEPTPAVVAKALTHTVDSVGLVRGEAVAHEAVVRPHAEGQLAGLEGLGYGETEAVVEYRTAGGRGKSGSKGGRVSKKGNPSPCPLCRPYAGVVMTLSRAKGLIPRHPHCLCSWVPVSTTRPLDGPALNFNPRQARDAVGRFASGAGASARGALGFAGSAVAGKVSGAIAAGSGIEHAAKEFVRDGVGKVLARLPSGLRATVEASYYATRSGTKAAFITWQVGQALAERVAKERGLSEDKARLLRSTLAKVDLVAMKSISVTLGATGVGAAGVGAASLIPPATAGYLAYSTARNPAATARAARGLVRDALKRLQGPSTLPKAPPTFRPTVEQIGNTYKKESPVGQVGNRRDDDPTARREAQTKALANANQLADLLAKHNYDDWFLALFSTALDETGDVHRAAQLASRLYREHPSTKIENVFCPTGKGGGIDPKCSTGKGGSKGRTSAKLPKAVSVVSSPAPAGYDPGVTLRPSVTRAFNGVPTAAKTKLSKQETGRIGEAIVVAYLQGQGRTDAKPMNLDRNNFPIDLVQDHEVVEVKAGLASNSAGAQRWRLTIGEPGKAEKAALDAMGKYEKAAWNTEKQRKIHERKEGILRKLSKHFGTKIKAATMTVIINPDTKTADLYRFEGFHDRIGWTSGQAQAGYLGSVRYETNG